MPFNTKFNTTATNGVSRGLDSSSSSASPVAADRNPYLDRNALNVYLKPDGTNVAGTDKKPDWINGNFYDPDGVRNAAAHTREGQNVLYADGRVSFQDKPNCGNQSDNIYQFWTSNYEASGTDAKKFMQFGQTGESDKPLKAKFTSAKTLGPWGYKDALLINHQN
jgi:hypothetical protein